MKKLFFACLMFSASVFAQSNTEVYLYDLKKDKGTFSLGDGKNISNNPGYDSQPHFYSKKVLVFSSTRNNQTDIAAYTIKTGEINFINSTPNGGEYSPQRIPKSKDISAVRLDTDGLQRFYRYKYKTGENTEIIPDLKVAYPMWYTKNTAVTVVIVGNSLDLIISDLASKENKTIQKKVGRSVHKIPKTKLVSYISKAKDQWEIRSLNPKTGETKKIINTLGKTEDICWLPNGTILLAKGNSIMSYNPNNDKDWTVFHTFNSHKNISRIIVNSKGTQLALVSD
ncbi:hypothetical protein [Polaribacter pacificus]|nr:hypothetical protein [Polaribacter pacificus]